MFDQLPLAIGDFQRQDLNIGPNFQDAEVLLELVEYKVILPVVAYSRLRGMAADHLVLKFNQTEFKVERILFDLTKKPDEDGRIAEQETLAVYPITKIDEAVTGLRETVEALAGHECGAGCTHESQKQPA